MLFKRLELIGFKSFGDRTTFDFDTGITTIVGPNGCGKSNVADAIRWVLGEQSAKALRGSKMEDVIFNGTDERPGINIAEVSFTLEDPQKVLPLGFHEITVTRRVFRDGQSEYLINKNPCRLKDIHELFMGTGIGTDDYSILEQGKIDRVLNAKPQERREIFEEAAGITKFRMKKDEALRKLQQTEENLIRVNDIVKEVRRQIHSVQRYAAKARQYRKLFDEMKELQIACGAHQFGEITSSYQKALQELSEIYAGQKQNHSLSEEAQGQLNGLRETLAAIADSHEELREEVSRLQGFLREREGQYRYDSQRVGELEKSVAKWQAEIQEHKERIGKLEKSLESAQSELDALTQEVETIGKEVHIQDQDIRQRQEAIRALSQRQKQLQEKMLEDELNATRWRNEAAGIATSHKSCVVKKQRLLAERESLGTQCARLELELGTMRQEMQQQDLKGETLRSQLVQAGQHRNEIQNKVDLAQDLALRVREELAQKKAEEQWRVKLRLERSFGQEHGPSRLLLEKIEAEASKNGDLLGILRDLLRVQEGYEAAVNAALEVWAADIVATGQRGVEKVRDACKNAGAGPIGILWKTEGLAKDKDTGNAYAQDKRVLGPLLQFVQCQTQVQGILEPLIADAYVARSWEDARDLAREARDSHGESGKGLCFVTRAGECVWASGRVVFHRVAKEGISPDGGSEEGRTLSLSLEQLKESFHDAIVEKGGWVVQLGQQQERINQIESSLREVEIRRATHASDCEKLAAQVQQFQNNRDVVAKELDETAREEERFLAEAARYQHMLEELHRSQEVAKGELERLSSELSERMTEREKLLEGVTHQKIQMVAREEKLENRGSLVKSLQERLEESGSLYETKQADAQEASRQIEQVRMELDGWKRDQDDIQAQKTIKEEELKNAQTRRQALTVEASRLEKTLAEARQTLDVLSGRQRDLEVQKAQLEIQRDNLRENLLREFQYDLQSPPVAEGQTGFSLEAYGGSWESVQQRIAQIRKSLEGMGSVNLAALQEHEELQSRYDFLIKQHEDLVNAKQSLLQAISKINTTTRKLFAETFAQIRENFQAIFVQLFGGGKADLLLTDETDILETGIEIVAKPPGKQLRNVSLLSGGEKALTAIALLFAVFQVKPSPFCILDEIDAPLDESNIARFVEMLREYSKRTQFIVITHNKRTISQADVLYGITMQESGISKVVSVRLTDSEKSTLSEEASAQGLGGRLGARPLFDDRSTRLGCYAAGTIEPSGDEETVEESRERSEE